MSRVRPPPPPPPWANSLFTVGVTGTNGKTSTSAMIASLLGALSRPVARVTTVGSFLDEQRLDVPAHYAGFIETMQRCLKSGGRYAAVEFTSEALAMGFAKAWPCASAVFTNLSLDHSDAHGSPEHYLASKAQLFMALAPGSSAVLNANDAAAALLLEVMPAGVDVCYYGLETRGAAWANADLSAHDVRVGLDGTRFELTHSARFVNLPKQLHIRAIGDIFVENALAALSAALLAGVPGDSAVAALAQVSPPKGRFQVIRERPHVVIDYAHTPDALTRTLSTARKLCPGRLSVVFGAGGERDLSKRPLLGDAARSADRVWLTSDNPRNEPASSIIAQIATGLAGHPDTRREPDRKNAIVSALHEARPDDVIVIAGKGHEEEQEAEGVRTPFSDEAIVRGVSQSANLAD